MRLTIFALTTAITCLATAAPAVAANGLTTSAVNMRIGPGTNYQVIVAIPATQPVTIVGCVSGYAWCDVIWSGRRGWVAAAYLYDAVTLVRVTSVTAAGGIPMVSPWVDARRDARIGYRVERRMDRRWDRWMGEPETD
jgi:uncharacterized protein YraI